MARIIGRIGPVNSGGGLDCHIMSTEHATASQWPLKARAWHSSLIMPPMSAHGDRSVKPTAHKMVSLPLAKFGELPRLRGGLAQRR